jgi:cytochrome c biogenesis protein CcmG/thiol:disulfide interchange protein DsbE
MSETPQVKTGSSGLRPWLVVLPLAAFVVLAGIFYTRLFSGDPSRVPSALIGKPVPEFSLPPLQGLKRGTQDVPGLSSAALRTGTPTLVNIWASWCGPCRIEHPYLMALSTRGGVRVVGINYKDVPENARRFLGVHGSPFKAVGVDRNGTTALDWGVYGVPETFLVDGRGQIVLKHVGPLSPAAINNKIVPALKRLAKTK